jgi:hypothetical protein
MAEDDNSGGNEWDWLWDRLTNSAPGNMSPDDLDATSFPTAPSYYVNAPADPPALTLADFDPAAGMEQYGLTGGIPLGGTIPVPDLPSAALRPLPPDDRRQGLKDVAAMTWNWTTGTGPEKRVFGPGTVQVTEMSNAPCVNAARENFYNKNRDVLSSGQLGHLQPYTNFRAKFGLGDLLTNGSPTQQFVGSYRVDVVPIDSGTNLRFTLTNDSSFKSLGYGITPAWERSAFGPGGNMWQTYTWTEPVKH